MSQASNLHEMRMKELIAFTREKNSEPYGCSIYNDRNEKLVEVVGNKNSPINHAEILAINECARLYPDARWDTLTLYTTGEPCCMCAAACCWSNLKEVVYATDVLFMIKLWGLESPIRAQDIIKTYPKKPALIENICHLEADQMFLEFEDKFRNSWNKKRWAIDNSE